MKKADLGRNNRILVRIDLCFDSKTVLKTSSKSWSTIYVFSMLEELGFKKENIPPLIAHRCMWVAPKRLCPSRRHCGSTISGQSYHHKCRTLPLPAWKWVPACTLQLLLCVQACLRTLIHLRPSAVLLTCPLRHKFAWRSKSDEWFLQPQHRFGKQFMLPVKK